MEAPEQNNDNVVSNEAPDCYFKNDFPLRLMRSAEQVNLHAQKILNKLTISY